MQGETVMDEFDRDRCEYCVEHDCHVDVNTNGTYVDNCKHCVVNDFGWTAKQAEEWFTK